MKKGFMKSALMRYMVSYTAIMIALFAAMGLFLNNSYAAISRERVVQSALNRLGILRFQHEEKLDALTGIGNQISLSYYISSFRLEDEPMKAYHIKQQLAPYAVTNDFIDQMYLIFHEDHYLYSSATSADIDMFVDKLVLFARTPPDALRALLRSREDRMTILPGQKVTSNLTSGSPSDMVTVFVPLRIGERFSTGSVMFLISDRKYQRMFADAIYQPGGTYIFYGDEVLSADRGLPVADGEVLAALGQGDADGARDITSGGAKYLLVTLADGRYGMRYARLIPAETIQAQLAGAQWGFGLFLLAISFPCMLVTLYVSRLHTRPIKALRTRLADTSASRDDFAVIQSGLDALMGRNEALHSRLAESLPAQKAAFVTAFVKGGFADREQAVKKAAALGLDISKTYYMIALVDAAGETPPDPDAVVARGDGAVTGYGADVVAQEYKVYAVFADTREALARWSVAVKSARDAGCHMTVAVSDPQTDFACSGSAYLEASAAYDNRIVMGDTNVLRFSDVSTASGDVAPFTRSYLEGFRKALRARDARALEDRIHELFQYLAHTELSLFSFRVIYSNVIGALLGEYPEGGDGAMDARQYYDVFMLSGCRSIGDLDDILRSLCRTILAGGDEAHAREYPLIDKISAYLREHFRDPMLSMSAVADAYGISAARLSLEFKEAMGVNPSDYLLSLRLDSAKTLLRETEMPVKEIGEAIGYYDTSGFIRRFKRETGVTPAQYRKAAQEKARRGE